MIHPYCRKWRRTKKPPDESERGEWKSWLKAQHSENEDHGIRSNHFMAKKNGETLVTLFLGGSKITADGDCSHEIKRGLLLGRKAVTNLDSILKSRDIILPTMVWLVKALVFPVVMWELDQIKLEVKKKPQLIPQKYKGSYRLLQANICQTKSNNTLEASYIII